MNPLEIVLKQSSVVAADTMVFIYHVQDHPRYSSLTQKLFATWERGGVAGVTSVLTLLELLVRPLRVGDARAAADYRELLTTFPNLTLVPVNEEIAAKAADLRARYGLRTPDAIQIATAIWAGAGAFVTNDRDLSRVGGEVRVVVLDRVLEETDATGHSGG